MTTFARSRKTYAYRAWTTVAKFGRNDSVPGWIVRDRILDAFKSKAQRIEEARARKAKRAQNS